MRVDSSAVITITNPKNELWRIETILIYNINKIKNLGEKLGGNRIKKTAYSWFNVGSDKKRQRHRLKASKIAIHVCAYKITIFTILQSAPLLLFSFFIHASVWVWSVPVWWTVLSAFPQAYCWFPTSVHFIIILNVRHKITHKDAKNKKHIKWLLYIIAECHIFCFRHSLHSLEPSWPLFLQISDKRWNQIQWNSLSWRNDLELKSIIHLMQQRKEQWSS